MAPSDPSLSIVIPVFNEEESLPILHAEIAASVGSMGEEWEVLYVDDRSTDKSLEVLLGLREQDEHVRIICFRRNFGQTAAMAAGFQYARGKIVVTLDGDLQNDPADIPRLVAAMNEEGGRDIMVGWRKSRQDGFLLRRLPSIAANRLISTLSGVPIHDTGCTLKAFRRELVRSMPIYAEQHRFLPVLAKGSGARIGELVVNHRARRFGQSKYGMGRALRVLIDLFSIIMVSSFSRRPLQYFALLALPFGLAGAAFFGKWVMDLGDVHSTDRWAHALLIVFMLVSMASVYFLSLGLLAELAVRASGHHQDDHMRPMSTSKA